MCGDLVFCHSHGGRGLRMPSLGARNLRTVPGFATLREKCVCVVACEIRDTLHEECSTERLREEPSMNNVG